MYFFHESLVIRSVAVHAVIRIWDVMCCSVQEDALQVDVILSSGIFALILPMNSSFYYYFFTLGSIDSEG